MCQNQSLPFLSETCPTLFGVSVEWIQFRIVPVDGANFLTPYTVPLLNEPRDLNQSSRLGLLWAC